MVMQRIANPCLQKSPQNDGAYNAPHKNHSGGDIAPVFVAMVIINAAMSFVSNMVENQTIDGKNNEAGKKDD